MREVAALEGWYTLDKEKPNLIGSQCESCGTYYFPKQSVFCRNPDCEGETFKDVELSRTGTIWSYTNAEYKPPAPFVAEEDFQPFPLAAVRLEKEKMIILGQLMPDVSLDDIKVGDEVELVLDRLHLDETDDGEQVEKLTWKWKPLKS